MNALLGRLRLLTLTPGLWLLAACVTVNIYFPAAAAERAADQIIRDVWGPAAEAPPAAPSSGARSVLPEAQRWAARVLEAVIPAANAQTVDLNVSGPAISALKAAMAARHDRLEAHYASGAVGLTRDGGVVVRDLNAIALAQRTPVNGLVADENRDRAALYAEIARANGHPEWEAEIRATFARRWIENARPGWWYQGAGGAWQQK